MSAETPQDTCPLLPARLLVPWVALLGLALLVEVGIGEQGVDYPTPFAVAHAYRVLVGAQLFFLLVACPALWRRADRRPLGALLDAVLLLALGAPAVVVAAWVADCTWGQVAASQGYLVLAAGFMAAVLHADGAGRFRGWYWLALGALGAGAPLVAFVAEDLLRARVGWLYALSPFWVADRLCQPWAFGWHWALPSLAMLLVAAALLALSSTRSRLTAPAQQLY